MRVMVVGAIVGTAVPVLERNLIWEASEIWEVPILDEPVEKKERLPMLFTGVTG